MEISVIIPVYNEEKYISQCLTSLLAQSVKLNEILVADDGSTDKTPKIIERFPVKLFRHPHLGVSKQCNFLAKKAQGEILVRLDGDIYFSKDYIKKIIEPIVKGKAIATFSKEEYVANPDNIWSICWSFNSGLPADKRIPHDMPSEAWTFRAILKNEFLKVGGYSELGYGEDDKSVLVKLNKKAKEAKGAICYHYNPSSLSEVFYSSRFIGRGDIYNNRKLKGLAIHSIFNSFRAGLFGSIKNKKPEYLFFKIVFDLGMTVGILERFLLGKIWK